MSPDGLRALVVDDEAPARDELAYLLQRDPRVGPVHQCASATDALRELREHEVDVLFLDVQMPGLTGLELAEVLGRFAEPPAVVFVTAHEQHAVSAFDLSAADYVLKPVREERLAEAVRRVLERSGRAAERPDEQVAVERAGVTRLLARSEIRFVEAQGDYARLHTADDAYLLRTPLSALAEQWAEAGFVRVHRSLLVSLAHVAEVRLDGGRCSVLVDGHLLQVSRRHTPQLRELLSRRGRP